MDTLGHLLALHVTPANTDDRTQVARMADAIQRATGENVSPAFVDQGYQGERASEAAKREGFELRVVEHHDAKHGFLLLPNRWVVERSFAWATRFRRLAKDYGRLSKILEGLHHVAFACIMLTQALRPEASP